VEQASVPAPEVEAGAEPAIPAASDVPPTEPELARRDDDLASQIQSLLDESAAEEDDGSATLGEAAGPPPRTDADDELDGDSFVSPDDLMAEAAAEEGAPADAPLIDQIDGLLAENAEDVIAGEFEDVDSILGVPDTSGKHVADPADDPGEEAGPTPAAAEDNGLGDDELEGGFESLNELLEPAASAAPPVPVEDDDEEEDGDDLDGMFMPPSAVTSPPPEVPAPVEESAPADDEEGEFASIDAMLNAPPPSPEEAEGVPPPPAPSGPPASANDTPRPSTTAKRFVFNPDALRALVALLVSGLLGGCALVNRPLDKLPDEVRQTVGWVALAVAGPGLLLIGYGLFFN
ncbi:MAG: hypothetical protein AAGL98_03500, partial [Planctomycetota bacterium]